MSQFTKIIVGVLVAVIVVGGGYLLVSKMITGKSDQSGTIATSTESASAVSATSPKDTSNDALDKDMTSINAQMNGLDSDSANVDQSFNDKPVSQQ